MGKVKRLAMEKTGRVVMTVGMVGMVAQTVVQTVVQREVGYCHEYW